MNTSQVMVAVVIACPVFYWLLVNLTNLKDLPNRYKQFFELKNREKKTEKFQVPYIIKLLDKATLKPIKKSSTDSLYSWQMLAWYEAYKSQNYTNNNEIACKLFGKAMPSRALRRKHSYPFLTQDTLRAWIDWSIIHKDMKFTPGLEKKKGERLKDGDSIFVKSDYIHKFATFVDPKINKSYVLVTGYSALSVPRNRFGNSKFLLNSPRLIRWFAKNPNCIHPKLEALALGLPNYHEGNTGYPSLLSKAIYPEVPIFQLPPTKSDSDHRPSNGSNQRPYRSYINFNSQRKHTSPQRKVARRQLSKMSLVRPKVSALQYVQDIKKTRFVISPPGVGWDCFRTWEAILFGAIPIVLQSSPMANLYRQSPVLVVKRWSQVTKNMMDTFQVQTTSKDVLFVDYWLDRIKAARTKWFQKTRKLSYK